MGYLTKEHIKVAIKLCSKPSRYRIVVSKEEAEELLRKYPDDIKTST